MSVQRPLPTRRRDEVIRLAWAFKSSKQPSAAQIRKLATAIGLPAGQVHRWFERRLFLQVLVEDLDLDLSDLQGFSDPLRLLDGLDGAHALKEPTRAAARARSASCSRPRAPSGKATARASMARQGHSSSAKRARQIVTGAFVTAPTSPTAVPAAAMMGNLSDDGFLLNAAEDMVEDGGLMLDELDDDDAMDELVQLMKNEREAEEVKAEELMKHGHAGATTGEMIDAVIGAAVGATEPSMALTLASHDSGNSERILPPRSSSVSSSSSSS